MMFGYLYGDKLYKIIILKNYDYNFILCKYTLKGLILSNYVLNIFKIH